LSLNPSCRAGLWPATAVWTLGHRCTATDPLLLSPRRFRCRAGWQPGWQPAADCLSIGLARPNVWFRRSLVGQDGILRRIGNPPVRATMILAVSETPTEARLHTRHERQFAPPFAPENAGSTTASAA